MVRDKQLLMAMADLRPFHSSPSPMKVFIIVNSIGHSVFLCRLQIPIPPREDSPPLSLFDRDHTVQRHWTKSSDWPPLFLTEMMLASVLRPPRIDPQEDPAPPEHAVVQWLHNRAPRLIPTRYRQYHPVPRGLVDFFNSNIHLVQVATLIHTHLCSDEAATAEARSHKRDFTAHVFLRLTPPGTSAIGSRLPDFPSASPTPETLPPTALAPPPTLPAPRPFSLPAQSSQASFARSDSKRPRLPGKRHLLRQPYRIHVPILRHNSTHTVCPSPC